MALPGQIAQREFDKFRTGSTGTAVAVVGADGGQVGLTTPNGDSVVDDDVDAVKVTLASKIAGEDLTNDLMSVEEGGWSNYTALADGQVKASAGRLRSLTFSAASGVTSGVITAYDNTAESGTVLWSGIIQAGLNPTTITLNIPFSTGLYIGYGTVIANVRTQVSYR